MFGKLQLDVAQLAAIEQLRHWTREQFQLPADAVVLVTELNCELSGCPPRQTVVAFLAASGTRHQFKIFKPVREVLQGDLPYAWMKNSLIHAPGFECNCC